MSIEISGKMPNFELSNANPIVGGDKVSFNNILDVNGLIILFECNHCPYVIASIDRINQMANFASSNQIGFIGINSNDPINYNTDSWENMVKRAKSGMSYAYLVDESQEIAQNYGAERTPEFYLINSSH